MATDMQRWPMPVQHLPTHEASAPLSSCSVSNSSAYHLTLVSGYIRIIRYHIKVNDLPFDIAKLCAKYMDQITRIVIRGPALNQFLECPRNELFTRFEIKYNRLLTFRCKLYPNKHYNSPNKASVFLCVRGVSKSRSVWLAYKLRIGLVETNYEYVTAGKLNKKCIWNEHAVCTEDLKQLIHCNAIKQLTFWISVEIDWIRNQKMRKPPLRIYPIPLIIKKKWEFTGYIDAAQVGHLQGGQSCIIQQPDLPNWSFRFFPNGFDRDTKSSPLLEAQFIRRPYFIESVNYRWSISIWGKGLDADREDKYYRLKDTTRSVDICFPKDKACSRARYFVSVFDWGQKQWVKIFKNQSGSLKVAIKAEQTGVTTRQNPLKKPRWVRSNNFCIFDDLSADEFQWKEAHLIDSPPKESTV